MTTIIPRFGVCQKCRGRTPVHFIGSSNVYRTDSDYCPWSMGYQPLDYALSICPKCTFIGKPDEFELEESKLQEDQLQQHWEETERLRNQYPMSKRFVLYAERIRIEGASEEKIGEAYLHGSWAERISSSSKDRSAQSVNQERECQQNAVKHLALALQNGTLPPSVENLYLIGELHRRTGCFSSAIEYFKKATEELEKEKYYSLFLEDAGPQYDVVEVKVRANSSITKEDWLRIIDNIPCEMIGDLVFKKAQEWVAHLSHFGATVSVKEQAELPNDRNEVKELISNMKAFAIQGDSENKVANKESCIYL